MAASYDVWCRFWDPILGKFGRSEDRANKVPLSRPEAETMLSELAPCLSPDYRGQGQALIRAEMRLTRE